jgi:Lhr-like helicase
MDSDQRLKAQEQFDQGTARVVVATVAFGMGVDKGKQQCLCIFPSFSITPGEDIILRSDLYTK